ncbi:MAG: type VI secretion system ATPase TssH [Rhodospirillales bacterium]
MLSLNLKSLIETLNEPCRRTLEAAAGLALSRSHYNIEVEHWLLKLLDERDNDLALILRRFEIDPGRLVADLNRTLDKAKTGNARAPALSPHIVTVIREGWLIGSVEFGAPRARSGHLLLALLSNDGLANLTQQSSKYFALVDVEALRREYAKVTEGSSEEAIAAAAEAAPGEAGAAPRRPGGTPGLDQFTQELVSRAKAGHIDPVLGRDNEIRQVIDVLTRRRQNNPILTGEAGVGKTAVVEGLALRVAQGDVPEALKNVAIHSLDLGLLQAGAGVKGEFENRLKSVIEEVKTSPRPIIMFIDEAHTLIGAGGQAGQGDAANLLKPALARGELRTIAATTWAEYKKYFERDAALTRRFQVVKVDEPDEAKAIEMMRGLVATLEKHHKVRILDEGVTDSVRLSARYIPARQLPDKSVSILDTAAARVSMSRAAVPAPVEDRRRRLEELARAIDILSRETAVGYDHSKRLAEAEAEQKQVEEELVALEARWKQELELGNQIIALIGEVEKLAADADPAKQGERDGKLEEIARLRKELAALQGENPLTNLMVDSQAIAQIIANWTGIPVGRMVSNEIRTVLELEKHLGGRVVGQPYALQTISEAIRTSRAKLADPTKPTGVFMLVGTSGVGKTETALALADLLYGGEQNMSVINMSEFKEEHKVSTLTGAPPGYVGYGEGGVLTEAVRRRPYSVVLLDEVEKAHPGVQDVFYQVFDKGMLKDGEGRDIDFKNTIVIMTSNAGTDLIHKLCADPDTMPDAPALAEALRPELLKFFKPAFLGRITVVPYLPLSDEILRQIIGLKVGKVAARLRDSYGAAFTYDPKLVEHIMARCHEVESGARVVDSVLNRTVLPELSAELLTRATTGTPVTGVHMTVTDDGAFRYDIQ